MMLQRMQGPKNLGRARGCAAGGASALQDVTLVQIVPDCSAGDVTALLVSAALLLQLWAPLLHTPGRLTCSAGGLLTWPA